MEKKQLKGLRSERVEMMVEEIRGQEVRGEGLCIFLVSGPGTALVDDQLHDQDGARGTLPRNSWRRVPRHTTAPSIRTGLGGVLQTGGGALPLSMPCSKDVSAGKDPIEEVRTGKIGPPWTLMGRPPGVGCSRFNWVCDGQTHLGVSPLGSVREGVPAIARGVEIQCRDQRGARSFQ